MLKKLNDWLADARDDAGAFLAGPSGRRAARRAARGPLGALALLILCLAVYLPGLWAIPPVDRDESRFAQASRQMLEALALPEDQRDPALHDGGLVIPKVADKPRLNKPPLSYWAQSASAAAFTGNDPARDAVWMYRVPSILGAILAVLATWRAGLALFDPRAAWLGAAMLAVCPMVIWDANQARADQLLLALTTLTMWQFVMVWRQARRGRHPDWPRTIALWVFLGLGVLAKGPITPLVVALTAIVLSLFSGRWRWLAKLRPLVGLGILAAIILPWTVAVAAKVGLADYASIISTETIGRIGAPTEGHWGPPGYHLVLLPVIFWPGSLVTALALIRAVRRGLPARADHQPPKPEPPEPDAEPETPTPSRPPIHKRFASALRAAASTCFRRRPGRAGEYLCIAWILPTWIVFELTSTKLPHYVLPLYPPIALLSARALLGLASGARIPGDEAWTTRWGFGLWLGVGAAVTVVAPTLLPFAGGPVWAVGTAIGLAVVGGWLLLRARAALQVGRLLHAQMWGFAAVVVGAFNLLQVALPNARAAWLSPQIIELVSKSGLDDAPIASARFHEDSLVFLTRGRLMPLQEGQALDWAREHPGGVLVAPPEEAAAFADRIGPEPTKLGDVRGFNYGGGRTEFLGVYKIGR